MILDEIMADRRNQLQREKEAISPEEMRQRALALPPEGHRLKRALEERGFLVIAEVKKASPSKGIIAGDFRPLEQALAYEAGGAGAISVLTEEARFQGRNSYLEEIAGRVGIPCLRKDFITEAYQVQHARVLGASAFLLIAALLKREEIAALIQEGKALGLDALVEVHTREELKEALAAGAEIIGINNRDLKTFQVRLETTLELIKEVPPGIPVISESGISAPEEAARLRQAGVRGILVGEALMRHPDPGRGIRELLG